MRGIWLVLLLVMVPLASAAQLEPLEVPGTATELTPPATTPQPQFNPDLPTQAKLAYSLLIENRTGGVVRVIDPPAQYLLNRPGTEVGTVLHPASRVEQRAPAYRAVRAWPHVDRSAVDAVDLCLYHAPAQSTAGFIQLLPRERDFAAPDGGFEQNRPGAVYLDCAAGLGIFGGAWPVIPGNPVTIVRGNAIAEFSPADGELLPGDIIIIEVYGPAEWPRDLELRNHPAGEATLHYHDGRSGQCGTVIAPVTTAPATAGPTLRPGVLSAVGCSGLELTCPAADGTGLLELLPLEVSGNRTPPDEDGPAAWGAVTGLDGRAAAGQPPFFDGYLYPLGLEPPALLPQLQVSVQLEGFSTWQPLGGLLVPEAAANIAAVRITWLPSEPVATPPAVEESGTVVQLDPVEVPSLRN